MARPTFTPVFEEAEAAIKERMLNRVSDDWRKEPGDFIHDAVAPSPLEVKQLQVNQDNVLKQGFALYAEDDYLDRKLEEVGLTRGQATANKRALSVTADAGVTLPMGHTLSTVVLDEEGNPLEYTVDAAVTFAAAGTETVNVTCTTAGEVGNVTTGSQFILSPAIPGVRTIVDQGTTIPGADKETDESAWTRYDFKVKNPDTGGNKNDYVRWAGEVEGVGKAKCVPRWNGNGTVKVVVVDTTYQPASTVLVDEVQEYLDPGSTGLGDGKAPCGARVTVVAATGLNVDITATVTYATGYDPATVKAAFEAAVDDYLEGLVFTEYDVVYNRIGALLSFTEGVSNYSGLTVNGGSADLPVGDEEVAVLGVVSV
jgi:uncharacterized phage protein gp47/JayE